MVGEPTVHGAGEGDKQENAADIGRSGAERSTHSARGGRASKRGKGTGEKGTPGLSLPKGLSDFSDKCKLSGAEKLFIIEVGNVIRKHETATNGRQFRFWTEKQPNRPAWARVESGKLAYRFYSTLGGSASSLPDWEIIEWAIESCLPKCTATDDLEQNLATTYKKLTGRHPVGYIRRPLLGEPPLTPDTAPDDRTAVRLLQRDLDRVTQQLGDVEHQLRAVAMHAESSETELGIAEAGDQVHLLQKTLATLQKSLGELRERTTTRIIAVEEASSRSANFVAILAAWLDAHEVLHDDLVAHLRLLNLDDDPAADMPRILTAPLQPTHRKVTRWVTVHLRAFLLARYKGDIEPYIDDSTGQLAALIRDCTLPSAEAVAPLLEAHDILRRFIPRMLDEAHEECRDRRAERSSTTETTVMNIISDTEPITIVTDTSTALTAPTQPAPVGSDVSADGPAMNMNMSWRPDENLTPPPVRDELAAKRVLKIDAETVVLKFAGITGDTHDVVADQVIEELRALEARTA